MVSKRKAVAAAAVAVQNKAREKPFLSWDGFL
jgi:hypothetical protein